MEEQAFLLEIQRLSFELDDLIEKYAMRDRVVSIMVTGLLDETEGGDGRLQAVYSYSIDSRDELDSVLSFVDETWEKFCNEEDNEADIEGLLDGLGIDLE
jgi:hypothetical protein|tara:strand:+ start:3509 stop:3808 length:300 start_codon:yes stop_codon:yes gene_type:complete